MLEAINEVRQILEKRGINKILADTTDLDIAPGTMDIYKLSSTFPPGFRHAILVNDFQATAKDMRFVEDVGVKRGHNIRVFSDREKALQWLNDER